MADNPSEFTEAEKRRMEVLNRQFASRQRMVKMKRRNIVIFGCLLASVAGIYGYTLFATRQEKLDFNE